MKRSARVFFGIMITVLLMIGTVACSKASEKEKDMTQKEIDTLKEEIKKEIKEEMQAETPAQNTEQEAPVEEQPNNTESAPPVTEQSNVETHTEQSTEKKTDSLDKKTPMHENLRPDRIETDDNFPERWGPH